VTFGPAPTFDYGWDGERLLAGGVVLMTQGELGVSGRHNVLNALATLAGQEDDVHYAEAHLAVAGGRLSLAVIPVQTIPDHTPTPPV
jgi:hypothetical protein